MPDPSYTLRHFLYELKNLGRKGLVHLRLHQQAHHYRYFTPTGKTCPNFLTYTSAAHHEAAILYACKLLEKNGAGLPFFFEQFRLKLPHIDGEARKVLKNAILEDADKVQALRQEYDRIVSIRDRKIAHFDRKHFGEREPLAKRHDQEWDGTVYQEESRAAIPDWNETEISLHSLLTLYQELREIVNFYDLVLNHAGEHWTISRWDDFNNLVASASPGHDIDGSQDHGSLRFVPGEPAAGETSQEKSWRSKVKEATMGLPPSRALILEFCEGPRSDGRPRGKDLDNMCRVALDGLKDTGFFSHGFKELDCLIAAKIRQSTPGLWIRPLELSEALYWPVPGRRQGLRLESTVSAGDQTKSEHDAAVREWWKAEPIGGSAFLDVVFSATKSLKDIMKPTIDGLEAVLGRDPSGASRFCPNDHLVTWFRFARSSGPALRMSVGRDLVYEPMQVIADL